MGTWLWAGLNVIRQQTSSKNNCLQPMSAPVWCSRVAGEKAGRECSSQQQAVVAITSRVRLKPLQNYSMSDGDNCPAALCRVGEEQKLCVKYRNVFLSWRCHSTHCLWAENKVMDWVQLWVLFPYLNLLFLWLKHHSQTTKQFSFREE